MRTIIVVNLIPLLCDVLEFIKIFKNMGAEYFMAVGAVKPLNIGILLRLARSDNFSANSLDSY
jgi:hypothetical protein